MHLPGLATRPGFQTVRAYCDDRPAGKAHECTGRPFRTYASGRPGQRTPPRYGKSMRPVFRRGDTYAVDPDISREDALASWVGADRETFVAGNKLNR